MTMNELDLIITGVVVKDFQDVSDVLESIGQSTDLLIRQNEHDEIVSSVSEIYLKLKSLEQSVQDMTKNVDSYIRSLSESDALESE